MTKNLTGTATTLAPGASTKFSLSFKPAGLGPRNATVEVQSNDPDFNPYRIPLKATSVAGASVIDVQQPAGISLNAGTSTVNYGAVALTTIASKSFIINNRGVVPLAVTSTTITGVNAADFHLATLPPATISPVSSASFTVTFAPSAVGVSNASLHIASSDPNSPFDVLLTASGVTPPKITTQPVSVLAGLGQAVNLVAASEAGATLQWLKNNTVLTGETNGTLAIASLALTHGGAYNLRATKGGVFASSLTANLGVVSLTPQSVTVLEGRNLTLSLPASGPGLAYQWRKRGIKLFNGVNPLHSDSTIAGVATARLSISSAALADSDLYSCQVTMPDPQHPGKPFALESAAFTASVGIDDKRLVYPPSVWIVSGNVTDVVTSRNGANSFSITGQPQGVTIDSSGHFSGKPTISITTPTVHHLTITATGPNGPCTPLDVDVLVLPLNSKCMGSFNGLVDQDLASPSSDGGTLALTIIDTGFATGKITLGAASFNLTGRLDASATTNPQLNAALPRPAPQPPLQLATSIDRSDGHLTGTLTDSTTNTTYPVEAWLNPWNTTTNPSPYAATYTAALNIDTSLKANLSYPQGCGFATITAARDGTVSWSGKLADGSIVAFCF